MGEENGGLRRTRQKAVEDAAARGHGAPETPSRTNKVYCVCETTKIDPHCLKKSAFPRPQMEERAQKEEFLPVK